MAKVFALRWVALSLFVWVGCTQEGSSPGVTTRGMSAAVPVETSIVNIEDILKNVHPDEPVEYTYNERFNLQRALSSARMLREFNDTIMEVIGLNEFTVLAYPNAIGVLEGTVAKQHYEIKRLEYELAARKYEGGELEVQDLIDAENGYQEALKTFAKFWSSFVIND
jgi:hypothetical protein